MQALRILSLLAVCFLATACDDISPYPKVGKGKQIYTMITVTDARGDLISTWVAEGRVRKMENMYFIKAVERHLPPPEEFSMRYANGRTANVVGPNIVLQEVPKPEWLAELDGDLVQGTGKKE